MGKKGLTVLEAVKFSRHDHMNDLQLLLMYLDMGKYEEARRCILERTADMQQQARLQKLGLPSVEEWLTTLTWRHPIFSIQLFCDITQKAKSQQLDEVLASYLQSITETVIPHINQFAECPVTIEVVTEENDWQIRLAFSEIEAQRLNIPEHPSLFSVRVLNEHDQWTCVLSGKLGGL